MSKYIVFLDCTEITFSESLNIIKFFETNCLNAVRIIVCHQERIPSVGLVEGIKYTSASENLKSVFEIAKSYEADLLYIKAPLLISEKQIASMQLLFNVDSLFGSVIPRFSNLEGLIWSLPFPGRKCEPLFSDEARLAIPAYWIISELSVACCLVRKNQISCPLFIPPYQKFTSVMVHVLCSMRRRTFRPVVDNSTVIKTNLDDNCIYPPLSVEDNFLFQEYGINRFNLPKIASEDREYFEKVFPSKDAVQDWYECNPCHQFEKLYAAAHPKPGLKKRLALDCRGMLAHSCGTTISQLGFLKGFEIHSKEVDIDVIIHDFALKAHNLRNRFPFFHFKSSFEGSYAAVVVMNQICSKEVFIEVHKHGYVVGCNMLDTIMWDMIVGAPNFVGKIWGLNATYLDYIFYLSDFSKQQFNRRFFVNESVLQSVTYLSLRSEENIDENFLNTKTKDYILVFGNSYDHKGVLPVVDFLNTKFPEQDIIAIGPKVDDRDKVKFILSGSLSDAEVEELVAASKLLIFPSWNEGFGLPVIKGLSYGKSVLVRTSPLWRELAGNFKLEGALMDFTDDLDLLKRLSEVSECNFSKALPQKLNENNSSVSWTDCANTIYSIVDLAILRMDFSLWRSRDTIVSILD